MKSARLSVPEMSCSQHGRNIWEGQGAVGGKIRPALFSLKKVPFPVPPEDPDIEWDGKGKKCVLPLNCPAIVDRASVYLMGGSGVNRS